MSDVTFDKHAQEDFIEHMRAKTSINIALTAKQLGWALTTVRKEIEKKTYFYELLDNYFYECSLTAMDAAYQNGLGVDVHGLSPNLASTKYIIDRIEDGTILNLGLDKRTRQGKPKVVKEDGAKKAEELSPEEWKRFGYTLDAEGNPIEIDYDAEENEQ